MPTLDVLREEYSLAVSALKDAATAIEQADDDADLDTLQASFDEAEKLADNLKNKVDVYERTAKARDLAIPAGKVSVGKEPLTYQRGNGQSIFRDLFRAEFRQDRDAADRLERHKREMADIHREKFDLSSTDTAGGHLIAPLHLQEEFVDLARAGRVSANVIGSRSLPPNTDSINIPRLSTGVTVADQADNAAVSETDAVFGTLAADVKTIAGMQDVSQQLVDRSVPGIDEVIFADLVKALAVSFDSKVITNTTANNKGILDTTGINTVTYTDASPTVGELYPKIADAIQKIHTTIFLPPTAILLHPRRWAFILAGTDTSNRPLVTPYAPQNAAGAFGGVIAEGLVGSIQGIPVYTDANIPTNLGTGTDEDRIIVIRTEESYLWEESAGPFLETFRDVGSGTLTVRFRLHQYWAQMHDRRAGDHISVISGTGLVTPTF